MNSGNAISVLRSAVKYWPALLVLLPLLFIYAPFVNASVVTKSVAPGVSLTEEIDGNPPLIIHVLTVDLAGTGAHIEVIPGQDTVTGPTGDIHVGREEVRSVALRHGAIAAVNGDFFPLTGDPLGAAVWNGNIYSEPYPGRCVMAVGADGRKVMFGIVGFLGELQNQQDDLTAVTGVDRVVSATDNNDLVIFTPTFGPRAGIRPGCVQVVLSGVNLPLRPSKLLVGTVSEISPTSDTGLAIPDGSVVLSALPGGSAADYLLNKLHLGDKAEVVCSIAPANDLADAVRVSFMPRNSNDLPDPIGDIANQEALNWATVSEVVGGGPSLIIDGKIAVDGQAEGFDDSFVNDLNPRTAAGVTADGKLLLVTVDGRQALSRGVSLNDLANLMLRLGSVNAINLDGGGSTTMVVDGMVINSIASTGFERPVADTVCVFAGESPTGLALGQTPVTSGPLIIPLDSTSTIAGIPDTLTVGQTVQLSISSAGTTVSGDNVQILWAGSVGSGVAYVSQSGMLTALQAGQGVISADLNGKMVQRTVTITGSDVKAQAPTISCTVVAGSDKRSRKSTLSVGVFSPAGMPEPDFSVKLSVVGGHTDEDLVRTNIDGYAQAIIVWTAKDGEVTLSAEGLMPKIVKRP